MTTDLIRKQTPEERELEKKKSELALLESKWDSILMMILHKKKLKTHTLAALS